ncbi:5-oxoprolinase subunit PxpB [Lacihabitans sp. CCS-44]|uniref:5-oxoprolinase subunit PxpB n=1 Tax=Lacihabitans sp. CCS-44 TaxID=2487331 RepID=UPI0020CE4145|nr:5-oxoprolinase subunit PxpB [Lacihabitans sp. CCS-44]MCP9756941.1 5-oxoprolinase subunit PxpB [Lacihabitans sp. CCS-44]
MKSPFTLSILSEKAICIFLNKKIGLEAHEEVLKIKKSLKSQNWPWLVETVPSYNSISIFVDFSFYNSNTSLLTFFENWFSENVMDEFDSNFQESILKQIPIKYDGIDLDYVSNYCKLSVNEFVALYSKTIYTVAMIGFLPGFPYLLGMDERLFVPRKNTPRLKVAKGSVGIGGFQTGVYPSESPGGWQIIGTTALELFDLEKLSYLSIGDKVTFKPI